MPPKWTDLDIASQDYSLLKLLHLILGRNGKAGVCKNIKPNGAWTFE